MPKIIISGCNGHMGRVVASLCQGDPQVEIAAGFDVLGSTDRDFPVFSSPAQFQGEADAVIDFSSPAALDGLLEFSMARKIPLVLATTGYTPEQVAQIGAAALQTPIFRSANMSLGINVLLELVKKAAAVLGDAQGRRKVAVVGDMKELGPGSEQFHRAVGGYFAQAGTDRLIAVGDLARFMAEGARDAGLGQADWFPTLDAARNALSREVRAGVTILVKASRSMAFEKIVDYLLANVPQ